MVGRRGRVARRDGQRARIAELGRLDLCLRQGRALGQSDFFRDQRHHELAAQRQRRGRHDRTDRVGDRVAILQALDVEDVFQVFPDRFGIGGRSVPVSGIYRLAPAA